ncbi:MAG: type II secretion system protein GspN [Deltaproteobacteria bacterium]|nr:type II secretion system protein GspN [Deltaproteobacteria bacterium]
MANSRVLRFLGYPSFFITCFLVSLYLTFPMDVIRPRVMHEMTKALNSRKNPGPYGKPGRITVESMDLYRFSGLDFRGMTIHDVTTDPDPAAPIVLDRVRVRVGLLGLLRKQLAVSFNVDAYDGNVVGDAVLAGEGFRELRSVNAHGEGLAWGKVAAVRDKLKVPAEGTLGGEVDLTLGKDPKDANGTIKLRGESLAMGPGELTLPMFTGPLTLPRVDLGKLEGLIKVADGKTGGPPITLTGTDIQGAAELPVQVRVPAEASQLSGILQFKLSEPFLKANPRYATVFDFSPQMKQARDEDGVFHFRLRGTVGRPDAKPDRSAKVSLGK